MRALTAVLISLVIVAGSINNIVAQERIKPSQAYMAGDTLQSPLYGIQLILPDHWNGYLTRGTEVFTLSSDTTGETSIMLYPSEEDLKGIEKRWNGHVEMAPGLDILPTEPPAIKDNKILTAFNFSGNDNKMGYSVAECGDYGFCYIAFLVVDKHRGALYSDFMNKLSAHISFFKPTITEIYGDYAWAQELKGKYMVTYESGGGSKKQNHLWLCNDGTFESRITRKGLAKGSTGNYKGKLNGNYEITGVGSKGKILLSFEDLAPLELPLEIKEEVIFMNGIRYSISEHSQCK